MKRKIDIIRKNESFIQFIKYSIVGFSGIFIDFISLTIFVEYFTISPTIGASMSFSLAVISNFYWNYKWVFSHIKRDIKKQFIKYFTVSLIGLLLTSGFMYFFVNIFNLFYIISKLITIVIVFIWNYSANKFWTFK